MSASQRAVTFVAVLIASLAARPAASEVADSSPNGFTVSAEFMVKTSAKKLYKALVDDVGSWWDPSHTFSGASKNLSIEAKPGGCFCEKLGKRGFVRHLDVVFAAPGKQLRLTGGLGPLQRFGVNGSMTFVMSENEGMTKLEFSYRVGGYSASGLDRLATSVDHVLMTQLARLKRYAETGEP